MLDLIGEQPEETLSIPRQQGDRGEERLPGERQGTGQAAEPPGAPPGPAGRAAGAPRGEGRQATRPHTVLPLRARAQSEQWFRPSRHPSRAGRQSALIDGSPGLVCTNSEVKISRSSCLKRESVNTHWRFLGRLSVSSWKVVSVSPVTSRHRSEALPVFCARCKLGVSPSWRTSVQ